MNTKKWAVLGALVLSVLSLGAGCNYSKGGLPLYEAEGASDGSEVSSTDPIDTDGDVAEVTPEVTPEIPDVPEPEEETVPPTGHYRVDPSYFELLPGYKKVPDDMQAVDGQMMRLFTTVLVSPEEDSENVVLTDALAHVTFTEAVDPATITFDSFHVFISKQRSDGSFEQYSVPSTMATFEVSDGGMQVKMAITPTVASHLKDCLVFVTLTSDIKSAKGASLPEKKYSYRTAEASSGHPAP